MLTKAGVAKNFDEKMGGWNVEQFDADGTCLMTIFIGPNAEKRAQAYADDRNSLLADTD